MIRDSWLARRGWLALALGCCLLSPIGTGLAQAREAPSELRAQIDAAIARVRPALVRVRVVSAEYGDGREIKVQEVGTDDEESFSMVGAAEANPLEGKISNESPLGRALLGKHVGDEAEFEAPGGMIKFKIIAIE